MPRKGERFVIKLKLDRTQRLAMDEFVDRATRTIWRIYSDQKAAIEAVIPMRPEELVERALLESGLHRATVEHACEIALEKLRTHLGGSAEPARRGRKPRLFAVGKEEVDFSVVENIVRIPHVGPCSFRRNKKVQAYVEGFGGAQLRTAAHRVEVGYLNNEPVLRVDIVDRSPKREKTRDQKLVRVVRGRRGAAS